MKYAWFKGIAQASVFKTDNNGKETEKRFNAPMGFVQIDEVDMSEVWQGAMTCEAYDDDGATASYPSIRGLERVYLYGKGMIQWKTVDGKAGKLMPMTAYKIRQYLVSCASRNKEIDRNILRPLLTAWVVECYNEASVKLDVSAISITGKRTDEFISMIGKTKDSITVGKKNFVTGNSDVVVKDGSAFLRTLCAWTLSVTQMKYKAVIRLETK